MGNANMHPADTNERIGRLETSVESFHGELNEIKGSLKAISSAMNRSRETNWGTVIAGLAVAGSIYAAAITPLKEANARQERASDKLSEAVIEQNRIITLNTTDLSRLNTEIDLLRESEKRFNDIGSPGADKRLTILELEMNHLKANP